MSRHTPRMKEGKQNTAFQAGKAELGFDIATYQKRAQQTQVMSWTTRWMTDGLTKSQAHSNPATDAVRSVALLGVGSLQTLTQPDLSEKKTENR